MEFTPSEAFIKAANIKLADKANRKYILNSLLKQDLKKENATLQYQDHELAKQRAAQIKWKALENLDSYLIEFEANFIKSGGKVIWAQDGADAVKEIVAILKRIDAKTILKSKSVTIDEIGLLQALKKHEIDCINTDAGELSQQMDHAYLGVEVGITGANYLIADIGAISLSESQGNTIIEMAGNKVHIVIAGIEKIIPSVQDLDLLWPLHSTHSAGQKAWVYNSICSGPKADEEDGPAEMYVVLLDNGRSNLLEKEELRKSLSCIRCGACLNVCPIYQNIGGQAYGGGIGGPIGSITMPHIKGLKENKHLTYASTLCGKCTDVCPVKIDLHKLFTLNRNEVVKENYIGSTEKGKYYFWKKGMLNREKMNKGGAVFKNFMLANFFKKQWGKQREFPKLATKSFNELWREKNQ